MEFHDRLEKQEERCNQDYKPAKNKKLAEAGDVRIIFKLVFLTHVPLVALAFPAYNDSISLMVDSLVIVFNKPIQPKDILEYLLILYQNIVRISLGTFVIDYNYYDYQKRLFFRHTREQSLN